MLLFCSAAFAQKNIEIEGVNDALTDNIRNHIGEISEAEQQRPRLLKQKITDSIRDATQALGYYEATFRYSVEKDTLHIVVNAGEPTLWNAAQISIAGEASVLKPARQLMEAAPFHSTQVVDHSVYEKFKRELLEACQANGFLDAFYAESRLLVDVQQHRATPILKIEGGQRYRFSAPTFEGSKLDQNLLQRLSPIEPGSYYSKTTLTKLQRNLQQSRYFREIDVRTSKVDGHTFAIAVHLSDAPRHQFSVGAGYGTDTGPRAKFRWERPFVNTQGHKLTTELSISQPTQTLAFEYHIPLRKPLDESLNLTTSWERKLVQDTSSTIGTLGFFFSDRYDQTWVANYGATFYNESYQQGNEPRKLVAYIAPDFNLTQIVLPEGVDPLSGRKAWLDVLGSTPSLGADASFLRTDIGYKQIFNTFGQQLLIARVEFGAINTGSIEDIPSSQRFFTGGDQTVRGYDFESLATKDANGQLIGGRFLNAGSVEYSIKVAERWRAAFFSDIGRAYNDGNEPWHKSVGIGARWLSPVGQIRVDFAVPINDEVKGFRIHIFIGPPL
ncbi:MAG: surface antigen [Verrucomicrobiaceae bacterium]|nr:surface antigen [Verrucomicrobiaceae bacterium]